MTDEELVGLIQRKVNLAMNDEDGALSDVRANLFDAYVGKRFGNERLGRSSIVTREVLEAVEWSLPDFIGAFLASPNVIEFNSEGPDDDDTAEVETSALNYYLRHNVTGHFMPLCMWMKDALAQPTAYLKVYPEERERREFERYRGLDDSELEDLRADPDIRIEHIESYEEEYELEPGMLPPPGAQLLLPPTTAPVDPAPAGPEAGAPAVGLTAPGELDGGAGGPPPPPPGLAPIQPERGPTVTVTLHDVEVLHTLAKTEIKMESLPGEEVLIDRDTTEVDLDTAKSVIHRTRKTYTELIELGYDPDLIEEAGNTTGEHEFQDERTNRLFREDENPDLYEDDDAATAYYWLLECYMHVDYDGDGRAEFRRIVLINATILENELCDYMPIIAMSAIPIPHKHNGTSPAELVYDLQRIQSQLHRIMLDNMYAINTRRRYISEDAFTPDGHTIDAIRQATAEWVPVAMPPAEHILFEPTVNIIGDVMQSIQAVKELGKLRTGIAPDLNVDPNVLQQSTAAAFTQAQTGAHKRQTAMIRVMGETGFRKLGIKLHQLLRQYVDHEIRYKLKKQWFSTTPSEWRSRTDVVVNAGLGHAGVDQYVQRLQALLIEQKEGLATGMATPKELYKSYEQLIEAIGLAPTGNYFVDPEGPDYIPPQPPPPSPVEMAQAEAMSAQAEDFRARAQTHMVDAQGKMIAAQTKAQSDQLKARMDAMKAEAENQVALKKAQVEEARLQVEQYRLQLEKARLETELQKMRAETDGVDANTVATLAGARKAGAETKKIQAETAAIGAENDDSKKLSGFTIKRDAKGDMASVKAEYGDKKGA